MKWHPDKNLDNPDFAEEVFKFIQQKLESGDVTSTSSTFTSSYSWRRYRHEWNNTAREHKTNIRNILVKEEMKAVAMVVVVIILVVVSFVVPSHHQRFIVRHSGG